MTVDGVSAVARVILDLDIPHLNRTFDYSIPEQMVASVGVGSLVRVKWGPKRHNAWVVEVGEGSDHFGELKPLLRVVSPSPLFTEEMLQTYRYLAVRFASTLSQVLSLAIPARRAKVESSLPLTQKSGTPKTSLPSPKNTSAPNCVTEYYPQSATLLAGLGSENLPRVVVSSVPHVAVQQLKVLMAECNANDIPVIVTAPTLNAARSLHSALIDGGNPETIGLVDSSLPPTERYAVHLRALRGDLDAVVGTRSAIWAPFARPTMVVIWDDSSSHYRERRNPQVDVLDVAVARSRWERYGVVVAAFSRSIKAQALVESGWAAQLEAEIGRLRTQIPRIQTVGSDSFEREGYSALTALPAAAYSLIRKALQDGPVLLQVPGAGRQVVVPCRSCNQVPACTKCKMTLKVRRVNPQDGSAECSSCGTWQRTSICGNCGSDQVRLVEVGADRFGRELGRSFPQTTIVVSASSAQIHRQVAPKPQIVVATAGAEPQVDGGYAAVIISEADVSVYADSLAAGEESLRRWLNAFAKARPRAMSMLCGDIPPELKQAVVLWRPTQYAHFLLEERREVGFYPAKWIVAIEGNAQGTQAMVASLEKDGVDSLKILGSIVTEAEVFAAESAASESDQGRAELGKSGQGALAAESEVILQPLAEPSLFSVPQPRTVRTLISCDARDVTELMEKVNALIASRSLERQKPVRVSVNPPELFGG